MRLRTALASIALVTSAIAIVAPAAFAEAPIYTAKRSNVAVQGYDPVAYFTIGSPTKGSEEYSTNYMGAEFRFASQANLTTFLADPERYAPQYGGYCAWAIGAKADYAKGSAKYWNIVDGKLYLNYNKSIQKKWNKDIQGFIEMGDVNWDQLQPDS